MEGANALHHRVADLLISIAPRPLAFFARKEHRLTKHHGNRPEDARPAASRERLARSENSHRHDRCERAGHDKTEAGLRRLQLAIGSARSLGKNNGAMSFAND